jgi:hypothetical protein
MTELRELTTMSPESRLWVYQCNRLLSNDEEVQLKMDLQEFLASWNSHGAQMDATAQILHRCVVVIALDESSAGASGCGIDKSVRFMQQWGEQQRVDMMSRQTVIYLEEHEVRLTGLPQFWAMRKAELISDDTLVIDPTILKKSDWPENGWIEFGKSWHQMMWGR